MSSLENTIGEVIAEAADIQHKVPGKGDSAPVAMSNPDADAEKKSSEAVKKAGDATKEAPKTNKADSGDKLEVVADGKTEVQKGKAVNQEEVEGLDEMTKSEMLKAAVDKMKEMSGKDLQAMYKKMETADKDGEDDEMSESLSRNAIIRKVVESLKDQDISEVSNFFTELDNDSDEGDSKEKLKQTTKTEDDSVDEGELPDALKKAIAKKNGDKEEEESVKKEEIEINQVAENEVLVKNLWMSVDPYMRGRMIDRKSYVPPYELGKTLEGGAIGVVVESKCPDFKEGDFVNSNFGWREYFTSKGKYLKKVNPDIGPLQAYLGTLGMPGMTAYVGLLRIGELKEGDKVMISAAAGAVGTVASQIAVANSQSSKVPQQGF